MWNKRTDEPAAPQPQVQPNRVPTQTPQAPRPEPPAAARPAAKPVAAIGTSMRIKGEIHAQEELFVDGDVEGVLESQSLITVGPNGKVKANIKAREAIIYGSVRGNVDVVEKVAIREQGSIIGDIRTAGISIDDGAYFKGSIDIVRPQPQAATKPVRTEAAVGAGVGASQS